MTFAIVLGHRHENEVNMNNYFQEKTLMCLDLPVVVLFFLSGIGT